MRKFSILSCLFLFLGPVRSHAVEAVIRSGPVEQVPSEPQDPQWKQASVHEVPLMPQNIVRPHGGGTVRKLSVRSLYDQKRLALLLEWEDAQTDELASAPETFTDACAVQIPAKTGAFPSLLMGDAENPVFIWKWSAGAQKDVEAGWQSRLAARPYMPEDSYGVYDKEAELLAGEKAGNTLSRRKRKSPVEFMGAKGYGSLTAFPEEPVQGKGIWKEGKWKVVFAREFKGEPELKEGLLIPIAFAVWDGKSGERNGMKSVSVWQSLSIGKSSWKESPDSLVRGKRIFDRYGCAACHGPGGKGGVKNPNSQGGEIPRIDKVKEGFTEEEIKKVILEGRVPQKEDVRGPAPPLWMNAWKKVMGENELDDLVKYLFSLLPEGTGEEW